MSYVYAVITRVPDADAGETGNLAWAAPLHVEVEGQVVPIVEFMGTAALSFRAPVFVLGEIVILDGAGGREVCGRQRKPSKWSVGVEYFSDLGEAVRRAREVWEQAEVVSP